MGRAEPDVPTLWRHSATTGRNSTSSDRHVLRASGSAPTALSLYVVWASRLSSQSPVCSTQRSHDYASAARGSYSCRMLLALTSGGHTAQAAEWSAHQCGGDASAHEPARQAT